MVLVLTAGCQASLYQLMVGLSGLVDFEVPILAQGLSTGADGIRGRKPQLMWRRKEL
jgi:hypothetical protein